MLFITKMSAKTSSCYCLWILLTNLLLFIFVRNFLLHEVGNKEDTIKLRESICEHSDVGETSLSPYIPKAQRTPGRKVGRIEDLKDGKRAMNAVFWVQHGCHTRQLKASVFICTRSSKLRIPVWRNEGILMS